MRLAPVFDAERCKRERSGARVTGNKSLIMKGRACVLPIFITIGAYASDDLPASMDDTILVTGGAGFIGSNFILQWLQRESAAVVNVDRLTYAGNPRNLDICRRDPAIQFVHGDICDRTNWSPGS